MNKKTKYDKHIIYRAIILFLFLMILAGGCVVPRKKRLESRKFPHQKYDYSILIRGNEPIKETTLTQAEIAPLREALAALDSYPNACFAYTFENSYGPVGGEPDTTMFHYDGSKPPGERRDFVLFRNLPATEKLKKVISENAISNYGKPVYPLFQKWIGYMDYALECCKTQKMSVDGNILKYTFEGRMRVLPFGLGAHIRRIDPYSGPVRTEYVVDISKGCLVSCRVEYLNGASARIFGRFFRLILHEKNISLVHASDPAFPIAITYEYRLRASRKASDNAEIVNTVRVGELRRVTCYEDRLRVDIGETKVIKNQPE